MGECPPPTPESPTSATAPENPNRTLMLVLSYLYFLALVPLLVEQEDQEIQWHAKHGLLILASWLVVSIGLSILGQIPLVGCLLGCITLPFLWLAILAINILCIVKALKGEQFRLPIISNLADRWR